MTTTAQTVNWPGFAGREYSYFVYPLGSSFKKAPGNYIFAKQTAAGWVAIYIGETSDLSQRFDNHHAMPCIRSNGATHIHVHESSADAFVRRLEESDLIRRWNPPCNG